MEDQSQLEVATLFAEGFLKFSGWAPEVNIGDASASIQLRYSSEVPAEGYRLTINPDSLQLTASEGSGFFYGFQTIMQLLPPIFTSDKAKGNNAWAIPSVTISDAPAFGWRGYMLDVSRHFFEKERIKKLIDRIAALKMNRLHLHLTDDQGWRLEIKQYPKLTEVGAWRVDYTNYDEDISDWWGRPEQSPGQQATYGGFYTQDDMKEIIAYAKQRFIEVVPEIDMPGHAQAIIAAYPEIGCVNAAPYVATGGVYRNNTLNPGKEETFEFIETMLDEVIDIFPFEYIHIGGDECNKEQWKLDPFAQQRIREQNLKDEHELQSYFIKRVEQIVNNRGKKIIGWDEILEGGLAPNATVMSWRGEDGGIAAAQAGHDVIMTPSEYCYLDLKQGPDDLEPNLGYSHMFLKNAYEYQLIPESFTEEQAKRVLGTQANLWTESITDWGKFTYMTYPRIFAVAENAWTREEHQQWDDFTNRLEPQLARLDLQNVRYATSAYNVEILHQAAETGIEFTLKTEVNHLDYYYTVDGSEPDTTSMLYEGPFVVSEGVNIKARAFRRGQPVGTTSSLSYPIHQGHLADVRYLTPYLDYKDAAGTKSLVDYNYASFTISDDRWQGFSGDMEVILNFKQPLLVSGVQLTNLRYTISGIYVPEAHEIHGSNDGDNFELLTTYSQQEESLIQGRNKVISTVSIAPTEVTYLKIVSRSLGNIPDGHHRAGEPSKMYVDEIVVL